MRLNVLDLELLRSFVSVVDAGGFTRAAERVHRTQSAVSQQIKRLEDDLGRPLLVRTGKTVAPTEEGERLLSYARRLLSIAEEARDTLASPTNECSVRLGIPEDFAAYRLTRLLASFSKCRPGLRLDVRAGQSLNLKRDLDRGDLDLALVKRSAGDKGGIAVWPERLHWVTSKAHPANVKANSVPLVFFPTGCLYRARAIHAIESAGAELAHGLYQFEPFRNPGRSRGGRGFECSVGDLDPARPQGIDGEEWLRTDRGNRSSSRCSARRQPGDAAARRSTCQILQHHASEDGLGSYHTTSS